VNGVTKDKQRGLLFACYQAHIEHGFQFIQMSWCNNDGFPQGGSGLDPIIGQTKTDRVPVMMTLNGDTTKRAPVFPDLVTFKGGEYFFVPSIEALKTVLGQD
jgi:deferrochelatase/peroxidase EfeB